MKYLEARPLIRSGDLIAMSHGSWRSWGGIKNNLVRIFTRSTYSHIGLAWVQGGRVFVLEAIKPQVRIFPLSQSGDFYLLPMGALWKFGTEQYALASVGADYSEWAAMRAYFEPLEPGNISECAAYVREVLLRDGIDLGMRSTPDAVVLAAQQRGCNLLFVEKGMA